MFTYKAVHCDATKYLSDLVCPYTPARALRSVSNNMLTVRRTHVKAGDNSFAVAAATMWNTTMLIWIVAPLLQSVMQYLKAGDEVTEGEAIVGTARRRCWLQHTLDGCQQLAGGLDDCVVELYVQARLTLRHQCL